MSFYVVLLLLKKSFLIKLRNYKTTLIQIVAPLFFFFVFFIAGLMDGKPEAIAETRTTTIDQIRPLPLVQLVGKYPPTPPYYFGHEGFPIDDNNFYLLYGPQGNPLVDGLMEKFCTTFRVILELF